MKIRTFFAVLLCKLARGQTGKLVGDLPTDRGRFWGMFAAIAAPLTVALTAILQFLL